MTVDELSSKMSTDEFIEWMAFYSLEPWGSGFDDMRSAVNTAAVYNAGLMMSNPKRLQTRPFYPKQFLLGAQAPRKVLTWQEQRERFNMRIKATGQLKDGA